MFDKQVLSGILGFVVGDALGVPVEFETRESLRRDPVVDMRGYGSYDQPAGTWSDDSTMTLCALESLTHGLDYDDMMSRFLRWANDAYMTATDEVFDMGRTTQFALRRYAQGTKALECGATAENENGNGSLMRILPFALYSYHLRKTTNITWKELLPLIHNISALTHAHPISQISCSIYCHIVHSLLDGEEPLCAVRKSASFMQNLYSDSPEYAGWYDAFRRVDTLSDMSEEVIASSGYVLHTLEAALWCLLHTNSYRDCVLTAVNLGSDTDTVAAIAGGLAGIYYGESAIPTDWLATIAKLDQIRFLCHDFTSNINV